MTEGRGERETRTPDVTINDPDDAIGGVAGGGGSSERATGTPNTIYNLSSVLFHTLQGGASYDAYVEDAEREGDEELTEFFRRVREEDRDRAAEARMLLAERTPTAPRAEEATADVAPRPEDPSGDLSDVEPRAEGASPGDARRTYAVTEMPDEDLTPPEATVPPDAPEPPGAPSRAEAGQSPRTEPIGSPSGEGDVQPTRMEDVASPRPEPTDDFPGTEPVEGEDPTARSIESPPPPEEIPPERAGEIPTAEEVPAPRTEAVPEAEDVPSGTPPQTPPGNVQRETSSESASRSEETPSRAGGASLDTPLSQEEMIRRQAERDRGEEDKGLTDEVRDAVFDEEGRRREGTGREDLR